jgi:DHA2 family multidrug resistance protein
VAEAVVAGAQPSASASWMLLGLGLATGMEFYGGDSMNLVLPDIVGSLGVSPDEGSWILTVYTSALFFGVPVSIWMGTHFGYRRYLLSAVMTFAIGSIGCAIAPDLTQMLFWRAVQGFAAGGLYVWWRASIYVLLPKSARSPSLMRVSTILYLSTALGLVGNGYITDNLNWRLIFLPNLIYAAAAIAILLRSFPPDAARPPPRGESTDHAGLALLGVALVSLQIILNRGQIDDWFGSPSLTRLAWCGGVALALFVLWQMAPANRSPLLSLPLLRERVVLSSVAIGLFTGVILSGSIYALPEYLREVSPQPHTAAHTGILLCIYALAAAFLRPFAVPLVARYGQRKTVVLALLMLIASMLLFWRRLTTGTPDADFILPLILYACCLSPLLPSVGSGTVAKLDQDRLLDGVSLYMTFRQLGASLGVAMLTILIDRRETLHASRLYEHLRAANGITRDWLTTAGAVATSRGGYSPVDAQNAAIGLLSQTASRQAATLAYADAFLFMAAVGVLALLVVPLMPPAPGAPR